MPYVTATIAAIEGISAATSDDNTGIFEKTGQKISGGEGRRAERDAASELKGAQGSALKAARDKAAADQQNADNRALGNALRRRTRGAGGFSSTILGGPLGEPAAPNLIGKTLLGS